jgi:hypothetical protein
MPNLLLRIQQYCAVNAANSSSLRKQGPGTVAHAQAYLITLNLAEFATPTQLEFQAVLDAKTAALQALFPILRPATHALRQLFPPGTRNWVAARKVLNIFLREVVHHTDLCHYYALTHLRLWLEVPLDSSVARHLEVDRAHPQWRGVKWLDPALSAQYQLRASEEATRLHLLRVHLDYLWYRAAN